MYHLGRDCLLQGPNRAPFPPLHPLRNLFEMNWRSRRIFGEHGYISPTAPTAYSLHPSVHACTCVVSSITRSMPAGEEGDKAQVVITASDLRRVGDDWHVAVRPMPEAQRRLVLGPYRWVRLGVPTKRAVYVSELELRSLVKGWKTELKEYGSNNPYANATQSWALSVRDQKLTIERLVKLDDDAVEKLTWSEARETLESFKLYWHLRVHVEQCVVAEPGERSIEWLDNTGAVLHLPGVDTVNTGVYVCQQWLRNWGWLLRGAFRLLVVDDVDEHTVQPFDEPTLFIDGGQSARVTSGTERMWYEKTYGKDDAEKATKKQRGQSLQIEPFSAADADGGLYVSTVQVSDSSENDPPLPTVTRLVLDEMQVGTWLEQTGEGFRGVSVLRAVKTTVSRTAVTLQLTGNDTMAGRRVDVSRWIPAGESVTWTRYRADREGGGEPFELTGRVLKFATGDPAQAAGTYRATWAAGRQWLEVHVNVKLRCRRTGAAYDADDPRDGEVQWHSWAPPHLPPGKDAPYDHSGRHDAALRPMLYYGPLGTPAKGLRLKDARSGEVYGYADPQPTLLWACCRQPTDHPGCWRGRHSDHSRHPDLQDTYGTESRGTEWLFSDDSGQDILKDITDAHDKGHVSHVLALEARFNGPQGGAFDLDFIEEMEEEAEREQRIYQARMRGEDAPELFSKAVLRHPTASLEEDFKNRGLWRRSRDAYERWGSGQPVERPAFFARAVVTAKRLARFKRLRAERDTNSLGVTANQAILRLSGADWDRLVDFLNREQPDSDINDALERIERRNEELKGLQTEVEIVQDTKDLTIQLYNEAGGVKDDEIIQDLVDAQLAVVDQYSLESLRLSELEENLYAALKEWREFIETTREVLDSKLESLDSNTKTLVFESDNVEDTARLLPPLIADFRERRERVTSRTDIKRTQLVTQLQRVEELRNRSATAVVEAVEEMERSQGLASFLELFSRLFTNPMGSRIFATVFAIMSMRGTILRPAGRALLREVDDAVDSRDADEIEAIANFAEQQLDVEEDNVGTMVARTEQELTNFVENQPVNVDVLRHGELYDLRQATDAFTEEVRLKRGDVVARLEESANEASGDKETQLRQISDDWTALEERVKTNVEGNVNAASAALDARLAEFTGPPGTWDISALGDATLGERDVLEREKASFAAAASALYEREANALATERDATAAGSISAPLFTWPREAISSASISDESRGELRDTLNVIIARIIDAESRTFARGRKPAVQLLANNVADRVLREAVIESALQPVIAETIPRNSLEEARAKISQVDADFDYLVQLASQQTTGGEKDTKRVSDTYSQAVRTVRSAYEDTLKDAKRAASSLILTDVLAEFGVGSMSAVSIDFNDVDARVRAVTKNHDAEIRSKFSVVPAATEAAADAAIVSLRDDFETLRKELESRVPVEKRDVAATAAIEQSVDVDDVRVRAELGQRVEALRAFAEAGTGGLEPLVEQAEAKTTVAAFKTHLRSELQTFDTELRAAATTAGEVRAFLDANPTELDLDDSVKRVDAAERRAQNALAGANKLVVALDRQFEEFEEVRGDLDTFSVPPVPNFTEEMTSSNVPIDALLGTVRDVNLAYQRPQLIDNLVSNRGGKRAARKTLTDLTRNFSKYRAAETAAVKNSETLREIRGAISGVEDATGAVTPDATLTTLRKLELSFERTTRKYYGFTDIDGVRTMIREAEEALRAAIDEEEFQPLLQVNKWKTWINDQFARAVPTLEEIQAIRENRKKDKKSPGKLRDLRRIRLLYERMRANLPIASVDPGDAFSAEWNNVRGQVYGGKEPDVDTDLDGQFRKALVLLNGRYQLWDDGLDRDFELLRSGKESTIRNEFLLPTFLLGYSDRLRAVRDEIVKKISQKGRKNPPEGLSALVSL